MNKRITGVHPCCSRSPNLFALAQHTQITWTAVLKCDEPSRVGRWRLGYITYLSNIHLWTTRPASYKKSKRRFFKNNKGMVRPNFDPVIGIWNSPDQNKNEICIFFILQ